MPLKTVGLQNGPDGVRLMAAGRVLDGFAYEGAVAGTGEGMPSAADEAELAFSRCPIASTAQQRAGLQLAASHARPAQRVSLERQPGYRLRFPGAFRRLVHLRPRPDLRSNLRGTAQATKCLKKIPTPVTCSGALEQVRRGRSTSARATRRGCPPMPR